MKALSLIVVGMLSLSVNAEPLQKEVAVSGALGDVKISLNLGFDRPLPESINMDLSVVCKDHRKNPNATTPTADTFVSGEKICAFDTYNLNEKTQILTVGYSTGEFVQEVATCGDHWKQEFDLNELCSGWNDHTDMSSEVARSHGSEERAATRRRGVGSRQRVAKADYQNQWQMGGNPTRDSNSLFGGSFFGGPAMSQARPGRQAGGQVGMRCPGLEGEIGRDGGDVACMSAIFAAESSCSSGVVDRRSINPHAGMGLCTLEVSQALRDARDRKGADCGNISTADGQIHCCISLVRTQGAAYFGARTRKIAGGVCGWGSGGGGRSRRLRKA